MIVNSYKDASIIVEELDILCKTFNIKELNMFTLNIPSIGTPLVITPISLLGVWILREYKNKI